MATKAPSQFWKNFATHLKTFYLYVAAFVGLMVLLVNGIIIGRTVLENTVFPVEYERVDYWQCEQREMVEGVAVEMTEEEVTACQERAKERAREDYANDVNQSYAEGVAGLLLGFIIWLPHFLYARKLK